MPLSIIYPKTPLLFEHIVAIFVEYVLKIASLYNNSCVALPATKKLQLQPNSSNRYLFTIICTFAKGRYISPLLYWRTLQNKKTTAKMQSS